jgi:hypothetical protein
MMTNFENGQRTLKLVVPASIMALATIGLSGCDRAEPSEPRVDHATKVAAAKPPIEHRSHPEDAGRAADPRNDLVDIAPDAGTAGPRFVPFKGVAQLPPGHPCHDDATTLAHEVRDMKAGVDDVYVRRKLGAWVPSAKRHSTGRGRRLVQGYRWRAEGQEYIVATCDMPGTGFRPWNPTDSEVDMSGYAEDEAELVFEMSGEVSETEYAVIATFMLENGSWLELQRLEAWSNDDEGNNPSYIARARIVDVADTTGDAHPEPVSFLLFDCLAFNGASCEQNEGPPSFRVRVVAQTHEQRVYRDTLLVGGKVEKAGELIADVGDPETRHILMKRLEANESKAIDRAVAILLEENKF